MLRKALPNLSFGLRASHKPEVLGQEPEMLGCFFFCLDTLFLLLCIRQTTTV